ncbi:MAG: hypothetical protein ACPGUV_09475, partial [Polyangiales bacterium]
MRRRCVRHYRSKAQAAAAVLQRQEARWRQQAVPEAERRPLRRQLQVQQSRYQRAAAACAKGESQVAQMWSQRAAQALSAEQATKPTRAAVRPRGKGAHNSVRPGRLDTAARPYRPSRGAKSDKFAQDRAGTWRKGKASGIEPIVSLPQARRDARNWSRQYA